jgi:hypothetical protein
VAALDTITVPALGLVTISPTATTTAAGGPVTVSDRFGEAPTALPVMVMVMVMVIVMVASTGPILSEALPRAAACRLFPAAEVVESDTAAGMVVADTAAAGTAVGEGADDRFGPIGNVRSLP